MSRPEHLQRLNPAGGPPTGGPQPFHRELLASVYGQAWGLGAAYLGIGLLAELLRGRGIRAATSVAQFLDALPLIVLRHLGLLDRYVSWVVFNHLPPFWNRVLLSSLGLGAIFLQATLVAAFMLLVQRIFGRRR